MQCTAAVLARRHTINTFNNNNNNNSEPTTATHRPLADDKDDDDVKLAATPTTTTIDSKLFVGSFNHQQQQQQQRIAGRHKSPTVCKMDVEAMMTAATSRSHSSSNSNSTTANYNNSNNNQATQTVFNTDFYRLCGDESLLFMLNEDTAAAAAGAASSSHQSISLHSSTASLHQQQPKANEENGQMTVSSDDKQQQQQQQPPDAEIGSALAAVSSFHSNIAAHVNSLFDQWLVGKWHVRYHSFLAPPSSSFRLLLLLFVVMLFLLGHSVGISLFTTSPPLFCLRLLLQFALLLLWLLFTLDVCSVFFSWREVYLLFALSSKPTNFNRIQFQRNWVCGVCVLFERLVQRTDILFLSFSNLLTFLYCCFLLSYFVYWYAATRSRTSDWSGTFISTEAHAFNTQLTI